MKRSSVYVIAAMALVTTIVSCKKETVPPTASPIDGPVHGEATMNIVQQPIETYPVLTTHGNVSLTYYANGKLKTVTRPDGSVTTYTYPSQFPNLILAEMKYNGVKAADYTYFLDGTGRCTKMKAKQVSLSLEWEYSFTYSGGKLVEQKATKGMSDKYTFSYDAQNRLQEMYWFKSNGDVIEHTFFAYHNASTPAKADKYPLNPSQSWLDSYLTIFGKFSKDVLVYSVTYKGSGNANWTEWSNYYYNFDAKGFVSLRKEERHEAGKPYEGTINVDYLYNKQRGF